MFGLSIPLLLQQIIDKVLSQGNLNSLNILGATMVVMTLFQEYYKHYAYLWIQLIEWT